MTSRRAAPSPLLDLRRVFEEAGVEFIGGPGDGPGVRLWRKS